MIDWLKFHLIVMTVAASAVSSLAAAPVNPSTPTDNQSVASAEAPKKYRSVKGDSFTSLSERFGCTVHALKKLNGIKSTHLKPGTLLEIPETKVAKHGRTQKDSTATPIASGKKSRHHSLFAQPVQDFDIAPSEFASCPPPPSLSADGESAASTDEDTTITPTAAAAFQQLPMPVPNDRRAGLLSVPNLPAPAGMAEAPAASDAPAAVLTPAAPPRKTFASALADFFGAGSRGLSGSEGGEWGNRFLVEAQNLAAKNICYDGSWRPDGESRRWEMDCSNTTRYLYRVTAGIALPRTASDQYYYLHLQDKAWDVPMNSQGLADTHFLRENLKPGDLLFWENTYRPERQPPITHVMIFLGLDARGRYIMAGSQGSKGFYNRRHSGPDVYVFDPEKSVGGYTTWLGLVHHRGRFVAYGRPLEADVKKLSVAAND